MIRIRAAAGSALRLLVELVIVVLTGEEQQPEQRRPGGRHSRRGTVPRDWSPLSAEVRRQLAPTFYGASA